MLTNPYWGYYHFSREQVWLLCSYRFAIGTLPFVFALCPLRFALCPLSLLFALCALLSALSLCALRFPLCPLPFATLLKEISLPHTLGCHGFKNHA
jgi:hypothetical protein